MSPYSILRRRPGDLLHDLALRGASRDGGQRQEQKSGGDLRERRVAVEPRDRIPDRLERSDGIRANQDREQDAADRSAGNQSGTEQRAGAQL
jgi:hypothetical protein